MNDREDLIERKSRDRSNLITAQIAQTMKEAGLQMDAKYFQERTGIISKTSNPQKANIEALKLQRNFTKNVKGRLHDLYGTDEHKSHANEITVPEKWLDDLYESFQGLNRSLESGGII